MDEINQEKMSSTYILLNSLKGEISSIQTGTLEMCKLLDNIWKYFTTLRDKIATSTEAQKTVLQEKMFMIFESLNSFKDLMTTVKTETGRFKDQMSFISDSIQKDSQTDSDHSDSQYEHEGTSFNLDIKIKTEKEEHPMDFTIHRDVEVDQSPALGEHTDIGKVDLGKEMVTADHPYRCVCCGEVFPSWKDLNTHLDQAHINRPFQINTKCETSNEVHGQDVSKTQTEALEGIQVSRRHNTLSEEDLDKIATANEKSTSYTTKWAVRLFKDWLLERGYNPDFEHLDVSELALLLRNFYGEVNNKESGTYSKSSIIGIRAGINRHLQNPPYNRTLNVTSDRDFMAANKVLAGRIKLNRERGLDVTKQKSAIAPADIDKMYQSEVLSNKSPHALQYKVFFELALQFGRMGRDGLHSLRKDSFTLVKDDLDESEYVTLSYNEKRNNQNLDGKRREVDDRMYSQADDLNCPVKTFKLYMSKLHPDLDSFYQKPATHANVMSSNTWYTCRPVGVNTLSGFMKQISAKAGLSKVYTNHCIRATTSTVLSHAKINQNDTAVTGHKYPKSLLPYVNSTSNARRKSTSAILHSYGKPCTATSNSTDNRVIPPLSRSEENQVGPVLNQVEPVKSALSSVTSQSSETKSSASTITTCSTGSSSGRFVYILPKICN